VLFVKVLLDAGADIEEVLDGMTPLIRAASEKNPEIVQVLIDAGANINVSGKLSTLFSAIEPAKDHYVYAPTTAATLKILCDAGADMDRVNDDHHSILSYALTQSGYSSKRFST
jgi:hypothetical protein